MTPCPLSKCMLFASTLDARPDPDEYNSFLFIRCLWGANAYKCDILSYQQHCGKCSFCVACIWSFLILIYFDLSQHLALSPIAFWVHTLFSICWTLFPGLIAWHQAIESQIEHVIFYTCNAHQPCKHMYYSKQWSWHLGTCQLSSPCKHEVST